MNSVETSVAGSQQTPGHSPGSGVTDGRFSSAFFDHLDVQQQPPSPQLSSQLQPQQQQQLSQQQQQQGYAFQQPALPQAQQQLRRTDGSESVLSAQVRVALSTSYHDCPVYFCSLNLIS
jgi:hypothetical protein